MALKIYKEEEVAGRSGGSGSSNGGGSNRGCLFQLF
jgi:hypothetical protein